MGDLFTVDFESFKRVEIKAIEDEIYRDTVSSMNPSEFEDYALKLVESYSLVTVVVDESQIELIDDLRELEKRQGYVFIKVPYSGSSKVLTLHPNPFTHPIRMISGDVTPSYIQIKFRLDGFDADVLNTTWKRELDNIKKNIVGCNRMAESFNSIIEHESLSILEKRRKHYHETVDFLGKVKLSKE